MRQEPVARARKFRSANVDAIGFNGDSIADAQMGIVGHDQLAVRGIVQPDGVAFLA
jgi:hypothetical protein